MKNKIKALYKSDTARIILGAALFIPALILDILGYKLALAFFIASLAVSGAGVFYSALRGLLRGDFLDEKFLMSIASVGAMIIGEWSEGVAVMLFFLVGEAFEHRAVRRSRSSIRALMDICPDEASVLTENGEVRVDAENVEVGSIILLRTGERVPVDCEITEGCADVDTSPMTGEPIPRALTVGDFLQSGVVIKNGMLRARALRQAEESAAARVLSLVENASENKAREENFITKFSRIYTPIVVALALLLALIPPILGILPLSDSVYRALIFLVISCPCALVISVPMAFFGGIGGAASRGILYKGGNVFARVAKADTAVFDKTGTLTSGDFAVLDIIAEGVAEDELLRLSACAEYASNHPISVAIKKRAGSVIQPDGAVEIAGEGVIAEVGGAKIAVGNSALMKRVGADGFYDTPGAVFVARDGVRIGVLILSDEIKPEANEAIRALYSLGIRKTVILSGDRYENVLRVKERVGIDLSFAELSPQEKYTNLEELIEKSQHGVIYSGDGINDAPALARADVGVAMGAIGQDSAIEAADLVVVSDNLKRIPEAIKIARKTVRIAKQNIALALGVKILVMLLGAFGIANMWLAVFADVGVAVLAILNSMRALRAPK